MNAATSVKLELNLYNVARGSPEELKLDYLDYLRQNRQKVRTKDSPLHAEFIKHRVSEKAEFREFITWAENQAPPTVQICTGCQCGNTAD